MSTPLLILTFVLLALLPWFLSLISSDKKRYNLPPSPPRLPIIGNFHQLGSFPPKELALLAKKHGSLMLLKLGSVPTLIVTSAESAKEIFKSHDVMFSSRPALNFFKVVFYGCTDLATAPYGDHWRQLKSLVVLQLLSNKRVREYKNIREEEMLLMMNEIKKNSSLGHPVDLVQLFASLASAITCRVAFGRKYGEGDDFGNAVSFKQLVDDISRLGGSFNVGDFIPWLSWLNHINGLNYKVKRLSKRFDFVLQKIIDDHIKKGPCKDGEADKDVVDVLLELKEKHSKTGEGMALSMDSIKGVVLDLFAAGTDTTSTTLEWAMAELIKHPEAMSKAQKEVRSIKRSGNHINEDDCSQMPYLKAVIKETLRLHPVLPLLAPRETISDVKLHDKYDIPIKTRVMVNVWAIGRDPSYWERPNEFDPERFLKGDSESARDYKGQDFEFLPFGAGRRGCPGLSFSVCILELVLANLLLKFNWSLPGGAKVEELDMSERFGSSVGRKYPLVVMAAAAETSY